jgi:hypothetical protein
VSAAQVSVLRHNGRHASDPAAWTNREHLQKTLQEQHNAIARLQNSGTAQARLGEYLEWAANALQHPGRQISPAT